MALCGYLIDSMGLIQRIINQYLRQFFLVFHISASQILTQIDMKFICQWIRFCFENLSKFFKVMNPPKGGGAGPKILHGKKVEKCNQGI